MNQQERWAAKIDLALSRVKPGAMRFTSRRFASTGSVYVTVRVGDHTIILRVADHDPQSEYGWTSRDGESSHDAADVDYRTGGGRRCPSSRRVRADVAEAIRRERREINEWMKSQSGTQAGRKS